MKLNTNTAALVALVLASSSLSLASAILVQPYNYMLDDSAMVNQPDGGSLSPFYNDQSEQSADKDIVSIIGERLARLRYARMLDSQQQDESGAQQQQGHGLSQEMAELLQSEQASGKQENGAGGQQAEQQTLSSSVANMLLNAAQAAAAAAQAEEAQQQADGAVSSGVSETSAMSSRGSIMELDTSAAAGAASASLPSKADLKLSASSQWFNPKETIPVLKISSMATPSKYKKVYFRSEKKLVDGAFHSPSGEQDAKKSLMKPFSSGVQRRSSRGTGSASAPPSMLQDGVIDFLKKFRDVYIQTRPAGSGSAASNLASSMVSAAASSPLAAVLAPSSAGGSRPNFASALSAASSMVNSAAMVAQAASAASPSSLVSGSGSSGSGVAAGSVATGAAANPNRSPLTAQSYVSFWSKTFPTWVRKMLKQLRRRSLYNSSKRQQQHHQHHQHHSASSAIGQAAQAAGAVASAVEQATSGSSSSSQSSSSSSSSSH